MKSKISLLVLASVVYISTAGVTNAQNSPLNIRANTDIQVDTRTNSDRNNVNIRYTTYTQDNATNSADNNAATSTIRGNATSTAAKNKQASTTVHTQGEITAASHRSIVATFVHSLLSVADREGGIGVQVRTVAQSQNDSASTTATALAEVNGRGSFHTFLTGSDYKNLGVIRRGIATTSANIAKLKVLMSQATSDADRAELNAQIKALEDEQVKLEAYIKTNESKFSLFGWLNRLFVK